MQKRETKLQEATLSSIVAAPPLSILRRSAAVGCWKLRGKMSENWRTQLTHTEHPRASTLNMTSCWVVALELRLIPVLPEFAKPTERQVSRSFGLIENNAHQLFVVLARKLKSSYRYAVTAIDKIFRMASHESNFWKQPRMPTSPHRQANGKPS